MQCDILYVITDLELGGVPLHLRRLALAMRDRGQSEGKLTQIQVVSLAPFGPVAEMLRDDGFTVHSCNGRSGKDIRVITRLSGLIRELRPRIIHSFLFHANLAARLAARLAKFPRERLICEIQTVEVERTWHLWVDRHTHELCRFTIGNSPSVIEHLHTHAGIPRDRLRLVRGGIDPQRIQSAQPIDRSKIGVAHDSAMILWVGRLDPVKGLDFLLDAFAQAISQSQISNLKSPQNASISSSFDSKSAIDNRQSTIPPPSENPLPQSPTLVLVGNGPIRIQVESQVASLQLKDRVMLLGARQDVPSLLKACDLFVFPSRTEGLPNALLEAMAAGCPIITTDVPGCRDLITPETTGLIVPYGDTSNLASAMLRLLTDQALAQSLGQAAAKSVSADWSIDATWNGYAAIYHEITREI
ncbi:MAG: glycosyltransferase [Planctomycetes bacterium]|nr:glycosyltransferase [Planctomycetota bacterium]MBI3835778.1 glycosyltransferase [Planctomycetota bacterium]